MVSLGYRMFDVDNKKRYNHLDNKQQKNSEKNM